MTEEVNFAGLVCVNFVIIYKVLLSFQNLMSMMMIILRSRSTGVLLNFEMKLKTISTQAKPLNSTTL